MTEEIGRRLVNGVWVTNVVNETPGGGGVPDPSGEPDGDVLTVSGGTAVWAAGGGSQTVERVTITMPSAAIISGSGNFPTFPILAGVPGSTIIPIAASAKLVFGSAAYQGAITDTDLIVYYGTDPDEGNVKDLLKSIPIAWFWGATTDVVSVLSPSAMSINLPDGLGKGISIYLNASNPLTDGDSDVELTVDYLTH